MKRVKRFSWSSLFLCYATLFLVSCNAPAPTPSPTATIAGATLPGPTERPTDTIIATSLPTSTFTPTTIPVVTSTPLFTETPTALPTLLPDEAEALILDLFENNGGCLLPCFWDFTPGQTEWQTAERSLATVAYRISYSNQDGTLTDVPRGSSFVVWMYLYFPDISPAPSSYVFRVEDEIITMIEAHIYMTPSYTLPAILNKYGQPTEVWLLTAKAPMEDFLGFVVRLFYSQQGFLLEYFTQGAIEDGKVRGCFPGQEESLRLVAWVPQEELAYLEARNGVHPAPPTIYDRTLEEATGMDIETFYKTFKDSREPVCLETPVDLWPGP